MVVEEPSRATTAVRAAEPRSKAAKLTCLEQSAIELFSRHGYEGTSLRDIASHAAVPLSAIDRHFGSKLKLFEEVQQRVWKQVNLDREKLLRHPISVDASGNPSLEAILYAIIYPVVSRALGEGAQPPLVRLLREGTSMRVHMGLKDMPSRAHLSERLMAALIASRPMLSRGRAVWALSFTINTMFCGQLLDGWLDELMPPAEESSVDEICRMMVAFCHAGISAVADLS